MGRTFFGFYEPEDAESDLREGRDVREVFASLAEWMKIRSEWADDIRTVFQMLHDYKMPTEEMKAWLDSHDTDGLLIDICEYGQDEWGEIGIDANDFVDKFLSRFGEQYFDHFHLDDLPECITMDKLIAHYKVKDILDFSKSYGFYAFLSEYKICDGDLTGLTEKFVKEIGYDPQWKEAIIDLIEIGAPVDLEKFVSSLSPDDIQDYYYDTLERAGASREVLERVAIEN